MINTRHKSSQSCVTRWNIWLYMPSSLISKRFYYVLSLYASKYISKLKNLDILGSVLLTCWFFVLDFNVSASYSQLRVHCFWSCISLLIFIDSQINCVRWGNTYTVTCVNIIFYFSGVDKRFKNTLYNADFSFPQGPKFTRITLFAIAHSGCPQVLASPQNN